MGVHRNDFPLVDDSEDDSDVLGEQSYDSKDDDADTEQPDEAPEESRVNIKYIITTINGPTVFKHKPGFNLEEILHKSNPILDLRKGRKHIKYNIEKNAGIEEKTRRRPQEDESKSERWEKTEINTKLRLQNEELNPKEFPEDHVPKTPGTIRRR
ncbi:hypothetical protein NPIL_563381, partial [Nephila pilipes]